MRPVLAIIRCYYLLGERFIIQLYNFSEILKAIHIQTMNQNVVSEFCSFFSCHKN